MFWRVGLSILVAAAVTSAQTPAFPGAQGGGAASVGGRGGAVCEVTNLNDSGANSLRDCLTRSGPRTVVFRVAGIIWLQTGIRITNPYLTIAGQTAPGGGILLGGKQMNTDTMIYIYTHDVIVRYIRVRIGTGAGHSPGPSTGVSGFFVGNADVYNVIIDHVSISWSDNKPVLIWDNAGVTHEFTMQWSIMSGSLLGHAVGPTNGNLTGTADQMTNIDFHHNLLADMSHRLPLHCSRTMRWVNNIVYNWSYYASQILGNTDADFIGDLYKAGPLNAQLSPSRSHEVEVADNTTFGDSGPPTLYLYRNEGPNLSNPNGDPWTMAAQVTGENGTELGPIPGGWRRNSPLPATPIPISADDVTNLESILLPTVGASQRLDCNGNWVVNRDSVDTRIINEYKTGIGIIPTSENDVGGFPTIDPGTPCTDTDHDGIPDAWEIAHGLNPKDPSDAQKLNPDGYTNLEHFLNGRQPTRSHNFNRASSGIEGNWPANNGVPSSARGKRSVISDHSAVYWEDFHSPFDSRDSKEGWLTEVGRGHCNRDSRRRQNRVFQGPAKTSWPLWGTRAPVCAEDQDHVISCPDCVRTGFSHYHSAPTSASSSLLS